MSERENNYDPLQMIGFREVMEITRLPERTIFRRMAKRDFPPPVFTGTRGQMRWRRKTVERWMPRLKALSPEEMNCFTYFIQAAKGGPIKIGKANDIKHRLSSLQGGSPWPLVCIACIRGNVEAELHHRFRKLRIGGEWFRPGKSLIKFIAAEAEFANIRCRAEQS